MSISATPTHRYRFTIVIIALILIMGLVILNEMIEEFSQYTPEDAWLILSVISIFAFVFFLPIPLGRMLSDMATYG